MPDVFLDEAEELIQLQPSATPNKNTPKGLFASIKPLLSDEVVKQINGSFLFELSGKDAGCWLLDLKNSPGTVAPASADTESDVKMKMDSENMIAMFTGKLNSTTAFMTGKLKISGNMALAMKLEQLIRKVRSKL